jgi:hypothetical protein
MSPIISAMGWISPELNERSRQDRFYNGAVPNRLKVIKESRRAAKASLYTVRDYGEISPAACQGVSVTLCSPSEHCSYLFLDRPAPPALFQIFETHKETIVLMGEEFSVRALFALLNRQFRKACNIQGCRSNLDVFGVLNF